MADETATQQGVNPALVREVFTTQEIGVANGYLDLGWYLLSVSNGGSVPMFVLGRVEL